MFRYFAVAAFFIQVRVYMSYWVVYFPCMVPEYFLLFVICVSGLVFLIGASVGSFLDVVRIRSSWGKSVRGRSKCRECKKELCWYELLPIVSYVVLWGRCSYCKKSIPVYHLLAEVLMGVLFVLSFLYFLFGGWPYIFIVAVLSSIFLVPIVVEDIERMEVPEHISLVFAYVAFVVGLLTGGVGAVLGGVLLAVPFFLLWFCSGGKAMGLGDAKVAVSLGFLLPSLISVLSVFMLTFWIGMFGLVLYVFYCLVTKGSFSMRRNMHVPLVPSMVVAYFLVLFTGVSFIDVAYTMQWLFV